MKLSLTKKIKAVAAFALVIILVMATRLMDYNHLDIVNNSLTSIYEDRLVAKDYIYKMASQLRKKELSLNNEDHAQWEAINLLANDSLAILSQRFATTRLSQKEGQLFDLLQENLTELENFEERWRKSDTVDRSHAEKLHGRIKAKLDKLAAIQLVEGRRKLINSDRAIERSEFISNLEVGILIIIGLIIQAIIFLRPLK